jgi:hypothetical protein
VCPGSLLSARALCPRSGLCWRASHHGGRRDCGSNAQQSDCATSNRWHAGRCRMFKEGTSLCECRPKRRLASQGCIVPPAGYDLSMSRQRRNKQACPVVRKWKSLRQGAITCAFWFTNRKTAGPESDAPPDGEGRYYRIEEHFIMRASQRPGAAQRPCFSCFGDLRVLRGERRRSGVNWGKLAVQVLEDGIHGLVQRRNRRKRDHDDQRRHYDVLGCGRTIFLQEELIRLQQHSAHSALLSSRSIPKHSGRTTHSTFNPRVGCPSLPYSSSAR